MPEQRQRILITGGTGLLGLNWAAAMRDTHEVWLGTHRHAVRLRGTQSVALNLGDPAELARAIREVSPDIVVHTAALTNVDECEKDPAAAMALNAECAGNVAAQAASAGIRLIHISTDHAVGGESRMAREEDPMSPLNVYARTKLEGERRVAAGHPGGLIVRTNFFGWGHAFRQSFSDWIIDALRSGRPLTMFTDAYFTPIHAGRLVEATHRLLERKISGVIHVTGDERLSKHAFALRLAARFGLPVHLIRAGESSQVPLAARRPRDLSLSNAKARQLLGTGLGDLEAQLNSLLAEQDAGVPAEFMEAVHKGTA